MQLKKEAQFLFLAVTVALSGCTTGGGADTILSTATGAALGSVLGALVCDKKDKAKCAVVGAVVGGAAGYILSEQQRKIRDAVAQEEGIEVRTIKQIDSGGEETFVLELEHEWFKNTDDVDVSAAGWEKLKRILPKQDEGDNQVIRIDLPFYNAPNSIVNEGLTQARADKLEEALKKEGYRVEVNIQQIELASVDKDSHRLQQLIIYP